MTPPVTTRTEVSESYGGDILFCDGLDHALLGVALRFGQEPVACYSLPRVLSGFVAEGMSPEEAQEYFDFNVIGAWVGEMTPCFVDTPVQEQTVE